MPSKTSNATAQTRVKNDIKYRLKRLKWLQGRLADVKARREELASLFIQPLSRKQKQSGYKTRREQQYKNLNERIAKLNFEILVIQGGTIQDQTTADWISKNKWKKWDAAKGESRSWEIGDKFQLDYGKEYGGKDSRFYSAYIGQGQDGTLYDSVLEKQEDKLNLLKIQGEEDFKVKPQQGDKFVFVSPQGDIVKPYQKGATKMLESDYLRSTDLNPWAEHEAMADNLMQRLSIQQNEANLDKTLTNGTK